MVRNFVHITLYIMLLPTTFCFVQSNSLPTLDCCAPVVRSSTEETAWIREQVMFWLGDLYPLAVRHRWSLIRLHMLKNSRPSIIFAAGDTSIAAVQKRYGKIQPADPWRAMCVLCDFTRHAPPSYFDEQHGFPINFDHGAAAQEVSISFARLYSPGSEYAVLWPYYPQEILSRQGLLDEKSFIAKSSEVYISQGSFARWSNESWARRLTDIGDVLDARYVVFDDGSSPESLFPVTLASHAVAIHTFPFRQRAWYYNGLLPWVHFIPLLPDASDLPETLQWCQKFLSVCQRVSSRGREHMVRMLDATNLTAVKSAVAKLWNLRM